MAKSDDKEESGEILEQGDIYFAYRPKVRAEDEAADETEDLDDVENFYIILKPASFG